MNYYSLFQMPTPMTITGRSSSITNAFINSIIPVVPLTSEEVQLALEILGMTYETFQCVYCGASATEWDHLRPLVKNKKPTGFISELHNLVPSCGKCNQSKGNKEWKVWMLSKAKLSPTVRGIHDITNRIERLEAYERWGVPTRIDFEVIVGKELWEQHWENCEQVQKLMRKSQKLAQIINQKIAIGYKVSNPLQDISSSLGAIR